jgi:hypothetical protein
MRLGYYVPASMRRHDGIRRRTAATVLQWRRLGHEVVEIGSTDAPSPAVGGWQLVRWERDCDAQAHAEVAALAASGQLDHLHMRLFVPGRGWARLAQHLPTSLEIHALLTRPESARDLYRVAASGVSARRLAGRAAAAIFVTDEMAHRFGVDSLRRIAIGNGVELTAVVPAPANQRPRIGMSVGSRGKWHGLDRLSGLAAELPDADWVVVVPADLGHWAGSELGRETMVRIVATSSRAEYDTAISRLDGAMGTLALDRRGLSEAAPLKVRDYAASGIPLLLPYRDTNLAAADDPAVAQVDPRDREGTVRVVREWLDHLPGSRLAEATRALVDLGPIERRRMEFLADK